MLSNWWGCGCIFSQTSTQTCRHTERHILNWFPFPPLFITLRVSVQDFPLRIITCCFSHCDQKKNSQNQHDIMCVPVQNLHIEYLTKCYCYCIIMPSGKEGQHCTAAAAPSRDLSLSSAGSHREWLWEKSRRDHFKADMLQFLNSNQPSTDHCLLSCCEIALAWLQFSSLSLCVISINHFADYCWCSG